MSRRPSRRHCIPDGTTGTVAVTRIPFDSFCLSAVVEELQDYVGGKVQAIRQPSESDVVLGLYARGAEAALLISSDPTFARAHFVTRRVATLTPPPALCATLRARIDGARLLSAAQIQGDRLLELCFDTPGGIFRLFAELMGKHSNLILVEPGGRVLAAAKWVGAAKSRRPIQSGTPYLLPPVLLGGDDLKPSPFYRSLTGALGRPPELGQAVLAPGYGAYPASVAALDLPEFPRPSISIALEQHFAHAIPSHAAESLRANLAGQLGRVRLAREVALADLRQALSSGEKASRWQRFGELLLAYGASSPAGATQLAAWDYDGAEVVIPMDGEKDFKANAAAYFERAKRAKGSMGAVRAQIQRLAADLELVESALIQIATAERLDVLEALREEARRRRWLNEQVVPEKNKEDRPYEGHRIRELAAPGGWTVLFGENAEANDYLTLRVARPSDWWVHVRGGTSAHVVVVTRNQPDRVQRDAIEFAARIAVQHSTSKHAGYVPVDFTLRKYVRKPRGAAKGAALYSHERTIHVDGG